MVRLQPAVLLVFAAFALLLGAACTQQDAPLSAPGTAAPASDFSRLEGRPDLNGLWQANGTANWNLEAHAAADLPNFPGLGAIAAIPAGISYVDTPDGKIPYLPEALAKRDENRAGWPATA